MERVCSTQGSFAKFIKKTGKLEGKRPPRGINHRWEDNIKMQIREIGYDVWIGLILLRICTSDGFF